MRGRREESRFIADVRRRGRHGKSAAQVGGSGDAAGRHGNVALGGDDGIAADVDAEIAHVADRVEAEGSGGFEHAHGGFAAGAGVEAGIVAGFAAENVAQVGCPGFEGVACNDGFSEDERGGLRAGAGCAWRGKGVHADGGECGFAGVEFGKMPKFDAAADQKAENDCGGGKAEQEKKFHCGVPMRGVRGRRRCRRPSFRMHRR